ncbi:MAG: autotransporter-associated beta strand repeat-containing protein [Planctomycetales bacterium]|nr:autotransporter-associated beta strand repeat-containing protein [Planctomycetales bacterium]
MPSPIDEFQETQGGAAPSRRRHHTSFVVAAILAFAIVPREATSQVYYWDPDTNIGNNSPFGAGLGGTGSWNTFDSVWWDGAASFYWPNFNTDSAIFDGTSGTVTLDTGIVANSLVFRKPGYLLTGGDLTAAGTSPSIRVAMGDLATINSRIEGTSGLIKTGGGALRLGNSLNNYTGTTTINNGALVIAHGGALGNNSLANPDAIIVTGSGAQGVAGGVLVLEGGYASGVVLNRTLSLQGLGPTPARDTGAALISVRTNTLAGIVSTSSTETTIYSTGGRLTFSGGLQVGGILNFGSTAGTGAGTASVVIGGAVGGTGTISKLGTGALIYGPTNTSSFTGNFILSSGSMRVTATTAGSNSIFGTRDGKVAAGMTDKSVLHMAGGTLEVRIDAPTFAANTNVYQSISSTYFADHAVGSIALNGTVALGALTYNSSSSNSLTFNGRNGYGFTFASALIAGSTAGNTFTNNSNGLLTISGDLWGNADTSAARTLTIAGGGDTYVGGSLLANGGASFDHILAKSGTGTLTIAGVDSTLDGVVNVTGGALTITDFRSLTNNTSALNLGTTTTGVTLNIGTTTAATTLGLVTSKAVVLAGTTGGATINANQAGANPVVLNGTFTAGGAGTKSLVLGGTNTADNIINSVVANNSATHITSIVKTGSGTWALGGTNLNTGATLITGGKLKLKSAAAASTILVDSTAIGFGQDAATLFAGGTLELVGATSTSSNEIVGPLNVVSGANTVLISPGDSGGTASLRFSSVGVSMATTAATSSTTVTVASTAGLTPGMIITGGSITNTFTIAAILNGTQFQTSASIGQANGTMLTFSRPGGVVTNGGGTVNFAPGTGGVTIGAVPAVGLLNAYSYLNGANFAYAPATTDALLRVPAYDVDAGFVTVGSGNSLVATSNNRVDTASGSAGIVTQATGLTIATLKLEPGTTLSTGALVTIQTAANSPGGILLSGGTATIGGSGGISSGGAGDLVFRVDLVGDKLTLSAPITGGTGGFTKSGAGTLVIEAANSQSGTTTINEGTVQLAGSGVLSANSAAFVLRQGAVFDLNGSTTGTGGTTTSIGTFLGAGTITNSSSSAATLVIGGSNGTGNFTGVMQNGVGILNVTKNGSGGHSWTGLNTYTGVTTINSTGVLSVVTLANIGSPSGIGAGSTIVGDAANAASLVFGGFSASQSYAALNYVGGASVSTNRLFTFNGGADGGARIQNNSAVNAALVFSNTGLLAFGANAASNPQGLVLGGTSTADNFFYPRITDNGGAATTLYKNDAGLWVLGNSANSYTGPTILNAGTLGLATIAALPTNSTLQFGGGVLEAAGSLTRTVGTAAGNVQWLAGASGGFSAGAGKLTVSLGGSPTWGSGAFLGDAALLLNSASALSEVEINSALILTPGLISSFTANTTAASATVTITGGGTTAGLVVGQMISGNPNIPNGRWIASITNSTVFTLNSATGVTAGTSISTTANAGEYRVINVADNTNAGTDLATISGGLQGTGGVQKQGPGTLQLFGDNTYTGSTRVTAGTLTVVRLGHSSEGPAGTDVGLAAGGNTAAQAVVIDGGANLQYVGPGETSDRMIRIGSSGNVAIHADGTGPLVLTNVRNDLAATANTLFLNGTSNFGNMITSTLADNGGALQVVVNGGAAWILSGDNSYTGTTDVLEGAFGFGSNQAAGLGTLRFMTSAAAGSLFAYGGDRVVANALHAQTSTATRTNTFYGDYSLTFNGNLTITSTTSGGHQFINNIVAGKSLTFGGDITFTDAATGTVSLILNGTGATNLGGSLSALSANKTINLTYSGSGSATLSGASSYNGLTSITGTGKLILAGSNTSAGATTINNAAGTLQLAGTANGGLASGLLTMTTGSLQALDADRAISNAVLLTLGTVTGSQSLTFNGTFTTSGGLSRVLTNTISAGKLLTIAGNVYLSNSSTAGGGLTVAGTGDTTISGPIANFNGTGTSNSVTVTSSGTTTLSGANTYTNTTTMNAAAGTLVLAGSNNSSGATTLTAGKLQFNSATNAGLAGGLLTLTSGSVEAFEAARTVPNTVSLASVTAVGSQSLTFTGTVSGVIGANRLLSNNITGGTLTLGNVNINVEAGRTLTFDGTGRTVITGVVASGNTNKANQLVKLGGGSLTFRGNVTHDYTGDTTIGGGTFNGTGTLGSRVVVQNGGTLSAGEDPDGVDNNGVGKLTMAGSQWAPGAKFVFDFAAGDDGGTTNVTNWDLLTVDGAGLTLAPGNGIYTLSIRSWTSAGGNYGDASGFDAAAGFYSWLWVDNAGILADGNLSQFAVDTTGFYGPSGPAFTGGSFWVSAAGNDLYVNYAAVPEPGSLALVSLAAMAYGYRRRRNAAAANAEGR